VSLYRSYCAVVRPFVAFVQVAVFKSYGNFVKYSTASSQALLMRRNTCMLL